MPPTLTKNTDPPPHPEGTGFWNRRFLQIRIPGRHDPCDNYTVFKHVKVKLYFTGEATKTGMLHYLR